MSAPDSTPREHKAHAPRSVGCFVLTISDTKTPETDSSGGLIKNLLLTGGHQVIGSTIVRDEPADVARVIREARTVFTHVVIMTPYHDVAGKDWQDETWLRSIDPYVVGFMEGVPYAFILGRFSDTGIFPLHSELVADTMAYLAANKGSLKNFNSTEHGGVMHLHAYWAGRESHLLGDLLIERVDELLAAFEAGKAFDWLRDEWTASNEVARQ